MLTTPENRFSEPKTVVIAQNDPLWAEIDQEILEGVSNLKLIQIESGMEFLEMMSRLVHHPPALLIGDVNLRGLHVSPEMPKRVPKLIDQGSNDRPNTVGLRCVQVFGQDRRTRGVPIAISTVFSRYELQSFPERLSIPNEWTILNRGSSDYDARLIRLVESVTIPPRR